jgi:hypothetical protein
VICVDLTLVVGDCDVGDEDGVEEIDQVSLIRDTLVTLR